MPRIACLMMLRDEELLAAPWLRHHGALFGFENLYVYDNGSVSEALLATLRQFAARGVNLDFSHRLPEDYGAKGGIIGAKIREFQRDKSYDIVLPLDCDEFVAVTGPAGPSLGRADVMAELVRIHEAGAICRIDHCFCNVPGYLALFWHTWHQKCVIPVARFSGIDPGFHKVAGLAEEAYGRTRLTHIHLHCKPFALVQEGARQKLGTRFDITDRQALMAFDGVGKHLAKYLLMTAAQYYSLFQEHRRPFFCSGFLLDDFAGIRAAWEAGRPAGGHGNPLVLDLDATPFQEQKYIAANPDVAGVPNPFRHFLDDGYGEGRPMEDTAAGAAELAGRIALLRETAGQSAARLRDYARWAMEWGRYADAVRFWAAYLALCPEDGEHRHMAVIACLNARISPGQNLPRGLARFRDDPAER
jgi:hypothetical protein